MVYHPKTCPYKALHVAGMGAYLIVIVLEQMFLRPSFVVSEEIFLVVQLPRLVQRVL